jgi:hypothetical protein
MRTHAPAGRLAAGVDDLWPEPFGKPRSRDLTVMGGKAEPATALKSAAERRSSPAPPRRQFDHVTSFLKGWAFRKTETDPGRIIQGSYRHKAGGFLEVRGDDGKTLGTHPIKPGDDVLTFARKVLREAFTRGTGDFWDRPVRYR